jgi:CheY-like chemotaxis protein
VIGASKIARDITERKQAEAAPDRERRHAVFLSQMAIALSQSLDVLAVDDEADALALLAEILEAAGARVTTARSGAAALEKMGAAEADVLVADIGMPLMDGFELIQRVRASPVPGVRDIPAAALTAYARSEDRSKTLQSGFEMHLAKPIDPVELASAIKALARRRSGGS